MSANREWTTGQIGYCSNVHPTPELAGLCASIEAHFQGVRQLRGLSEQDSGLWISARAAAELQHVPARTAFLSLLKRTGLRLTSLNGFPYGQFHEGAVKAEVYLPHWADPKRLAYSLQLAHLLAAALPPDCNQGVISSVPLGYAAHWNSTLQQGAEQQLRQLTAALAELHRETGKKIVLCLEMEPDCVLENTAQAIAFFRHWQATDPHHEHLALCFDVCHQAVVFEDCYQSLDRLRRAHVPVGKIQLSSAMICRLPSPYDPRREAVLKALADFAEATYLHQVKARDAQGRLLAWADLPAALHDVGLGLAQCAQLRIHFHVPLFSEQLLLPELSGSQDALSQTFDYLADHPEFRPVLEVETYSWGVLPAQLRPNSELAQLQGIATELQWVEEQLQHRKLLRRQPPTRKRTPMPADHTCKPLLLINVVGLTPGLLGAATPCINTLLNTAQMARLRPVFPAVTSTVQASILTGLPPSGHGIVGNGWYFRDQAEVRFWLQPNALIQGEKVWQVLQRELPGFRCSQLFWWFNMYADVAAAITPRPHYPADGRKVFGLYTSPPALHETIEQQIGEFPFHGFWGPAAGIASSRWIVDCAIAEFQINRPHLQLIYLPHLDYGLQRLGPDHPAMADELRAIDTEVGRLLDFAEQQDAAVMLLSEYGIESVQQSVSLNRLLRSEGWLQVRQSLSWELLDPGASDAFAVADHQIAHIYIRREQDVPRVKALLQRQPGIEQVLDKTEQRAWQLDHSRSGELVTVAAPGFWFDYYYWFDDRKAPDFARTVDIHRKPGYDPLELFVDPAIRFPKLKMARRLLQKKLGFRYYMDLIPLDTRMIRGSHGRMPDSDQSGPLLITNCDLPLPEHLPATAVKQLLLQHFLGQSYHDKANAKELPCGEPFP